MSHQRHQSNKGSGWRKTKRLNGMLAELHQISIATKKSDRKARQDAKAKLQNGSN